MTQTQSKTPLPNLEGFAFRKFVGDPSFHDMLTILKQLEDQDWYPYKGSTFTELKFEYEHRTNFDIHRDLVFAFQGDKPVAYGRLNWGIVEPSKNRIFFCGVNVVPELTESPLFQTFFDWLHQRAADIEMTLQPAPATSISQGGLEQEKFRLALLEANGYKIERYFNNMGRDLADIPTVPLPDGFEVRPVTPDQYRRIFDASNEGFRDHWNFTEPEEGDYDRWLNEPLAFTPEIWQVAWDGDKVAGMVLNFIDQEENKLTGIRKGYTENITVMRPYRGRGLAKALIVRSMNMFKEMGMTEVALGVDASNQTGATKLYHDLGYRVKSTSVSLIKPLEVQRK